MTKITHKGLWFDYSSLEKSEKRLVLKSLFAAFFGGFIYGIIDSGEPRLLQDFPNIKYLSILAFILIIYSLYPWYQFYLKQDELFQRHHDFSFMSGFLGFFFLGLTFNLLNYLSNDVVIVLTFWEYLLCALVGSAIGSIYFYKKFIH